MYINPLQYSDDMYILLLKIYSFYIINSEYFKAIRDFTDFIKLELWSAILIPLPSFLNIEDYMKFTILKYILYNYVYLFLD